MSEGLAVGDVATFCKQPEGFKHNALVGEIGQNGMIHLIHVIQLEKRSLPQVELNVPWQKPDQDGRYYIVEAKR